MSKVFISYGRDGSYGQNLATEAQQQLQAAGFEVFRDVTGLNGGDVWYSKLELELESSDVVVLIVSEKIRKSKWVHNEISMAEEIGLPVIPVFAETVRIPLWLRHLQALDFSERLNWENLFNAIAANVETPNVLKAIDPVHTPVSRDIPHKYNNLSNVEEKASFQTPIWASFCGEDRFGRYADLTINAVTQRFRLISAGTFKMGSPDSEDGREYYGRGKETIHQVTISKDFWFADTSCTQAFWSEVMGGNPSDFTNNEENPVEQVSWNDVQYFLQLLNNIVRGHNFTLPTEAHWEYACRAGTVTPYYFGKDISANFIHYDICHNFEQDRTLENETKPVRAMPRNPWGLYQMCGNVWEWCLDTYQDDLGCLACVDPIYQSGEHYILRGGSWSSQPSDCRSSSRNFNHQAASEEIGLDYDSMGFRLFVGR